MLTQTSTSTSATAPSMICERSARRADDVFLERIESRARVLRARDTASPSVDAQRVELGLRCARSRVPAASRAMTLR